MSKDFDFKIDDMTYEDFINFKRRESNAVYGLDTGEGEDQSVNYYQVINDNPIKTDVNISTIKYTLPSSMIVTDQDISDDIDKVLNSRQYIEEMNNLYAADLRERYVRELLNRIDRCCRWLEVNKCYEIDVNIPIAILKNNISYIKERYDNICDIRSWDNYYVKDGEDVLAEILGVKDE